MQYNIELINKFTKSLNFFSIKYNRIFILNKSLLDEKIEI